MSERFSSPNFLRYHATELSICRGDALVLFHLAPRISNKFPFLRVSFQTKTHQKSTIIHHAHRASSTRNLGKCASLSNQLKPLAKRLDFYFSYSLSNEPRIRAPKLRAIEKSYKKNVTQKSARRKSFVCFLRARASSGVERFQIWMMMNEPNVKGGERVRTT